MDSSDVQELNSNMIKLSSKLDLVLDEIAERGRVRRRNYVKRVASGIPSLLVFLLIVAGIFLFYERFLKGRVKL